MSRFPEQRTFPVAPNIEQSTVAVLFDIDGTLVDSNYLHVLAWVQAFRDVGHPVTVHRCIGLGTPFLLAHLLGERDAEAVGARATEAHRVRYAGTYDQLRPLQGAQSLVRAVARFATPVLSTSASQAELDVLRRVLDLDDVIEVVTSAADVDAAKPAPDVVSVALERAGVDAAHAMFVGDTVWDVQAARRAGVGCVAVLTGGISEWELVDAGALAVYEGPAALLEDLVASPLGTLIVG
jgi:HAD superfamily hydrolase (TIGR01549 family)